MTPHPAGRILTVSALALAALAACTTPALPTQPPAAVARSAAALRPMVAFDAAYIPTLADSSAASQDRRQAPRAAASIAGLQAHWPALRTSLLAAWGPTPPAWQRAVDAAGGRIAASADAAARADWHAAHEALEEVRVVLREARIAEGMDYFVDRLTAYHAPMEVLALAGTQWKPQEVTAQRRAELEEAYRRCLAMWQGIESFPFDAQAYGLSVQQAERLRGALAQERAALDALGAALRGGDDAALLKAAAGVKPPFARAFTAFGRAD